MLGKKDSMTPPRRMINVGSHSFTRSDFHSVGQTLLEYMTRVGGLSKDDQILDVGCGVGRMAIQLAPLLSEKGSYNGFDIIKESIDHCTKNISSRYPDIRFHHADIFNSNYNPDGKYISDEYWFPFEDGSFSFVLLTSVFTHMLSSEVENYMKEIQRVLKPGGRCFITFFLLNEESKKLISESKSSMNFVFPIEHGMTADAVSPEVAVAFEEEYIRQKYNELGFTILDPIHYGNWCERTSDVGFQDIVMATKN